MDMIYIAHPVRPLPDSAETVESNLRDAEWYLVQLQRANPDVAFEMGWALELRLGIGDDNNPTSRAAGLARCVAKASRCTGIAICGPRIGSGSFAETMSVAQASRYPIVHRFSSRLQDFKLPPRSELRRCDFPRRPPSVLARCLFGASPYGIEQVGAEILATYDRETPA
jgi:hypothetical protein